MSIQTVTENVLRIRTLRLDCDLFKFIQLQGSKRGSRVTPLTADSGGTA